MPASRPAQTGAQAGHLPEAAGHLPEAAGLLAGQGRSPGWHDRGGAVVTVGDGEREERGKGKWEVVQTDEELTLVGSFSWYPIFFELP